MDHLTGGGAPRSLGIVSGPRPGRMRDRRGKGQRGPMALPGPLSPRSVPAHRSARATFDLLVGDVLAALDHHFVAEPDDIHLVVEEAPMLPPEWSDEVPLSLVAPGVDATRVVLFRLPMSQRCRTEHDLQELVWTIVLDRLSEIWHIPPDDLDPRAR